MSAAVTAPQVRQAIADTLAEGYTVDGRQTVQIYRQPQGMTIVPAIIIGDVTVDFRQTMQRGTDLYTFTLYVVTCPDTISGFDALDDFISGNSGNSIREIIFNNNDLGYPDTISAALLDWDGWGSIKNIAGDDSIAARGHLLVAAQGVDR